MLKRYFLFLLAIASRISASRPDKIITQSPLRSAYLFPQLAPKTDNAHPQMTTKVIELRAAPRAAEGGDSATDATELTISIPRFSKDGKGNWVYHYYAATYGKVWQDTRFNINGVYTVQRFRVDSRAINNYYPKGPLATVCMGRSTIYNKPKVMKYLGRSLNYNRALKHRPIWATLRRQIFNHATSEECHNEKKFPTWHKFQYCQIRRHQRMEYMIPKYPLHQRQDFKKR